MNRRQALLAIAAVPLASAAATENQSIRVILRSRPYDDCTWGELASSMANWQARANPTWATLAQAGAAVDMCGVASFNERVSIVWDTWGKARGRCNESLRCETLASGWSDDRSVWLAFVAAPKQTVIRTLNEKG